MTATSPHDFYKNLMNQLCDLEAQVRSGSVSAEAIRELAAMLTTNQLFFINNHIGLTDLTALQQFPEGWTGQTAVDASRLLKTLDLAIKAAERGHVRNLERERAAEEMKKYR